MRTMTDCEMSNEFLLDGFNYDVIDDGLHYCIADYLSDLRHDCTIPKADTFRFKGKYVTVQPQPYEWAMYRDIVEAIAYWEQVIAISK